MTGQKRTALTGLLSVAGLAGVLFAAQADRTTPLFVCGANETIAQPIPLTPEAVILATDGRLYSPCGDPVGPSDRAARERDLLLRAAAAPDPTLRRLAARAFGLIQRQDAGIVSALTALLDDGDARVRREAANAIGELLSQQRGDLSGPTPSSPALATAAAAEVLLARLAVETDDRVVAALLETYGRLRYPDDAARHEAEARIVDAWHRSAIRQLGALKGLEALVRQSPRRPIAAQTRARLRQVIINGPTGARADNWRGAEDDSSRAWLAQGRRLAMVTLTAAGGDESVVWMRAASDADWQVRRLAAQRLDWSRAEMRRSGEPLLRDPMFQVRYDALGPYARELVRVGTCAPLLTHANDESPIVAMRAIDLIPANCVDADAVVERLSALAGGLSLTAGVPSGAGRTRPLSWHGPARALVALARVRPEAARPRLANAASNANWQVRAAAAAAATEMADDQTLVALSADARPNVRTAAIEGLSRMRSTQAVASATRALGDADFQLVRAAAIALRGAPVEQRATINAALLTALDRLTTLASDTSRDPRVAIVERLGELLPAGDVSRLEPWLADVDPRVRAAASAAIARLRGSEPTPAAAVKRRYPAQPSIDEQARLPRTATITMSDGARIDLDLLVDDAPVTVARFAELARAGYYNGLTFHRIAPNFVVQGGSPGANEYVGVDRYWRDEVGLASNLRGTVGLSTRGRDTGDGQFYFNLVDSPRLDHSYTVFARVRSGLDVVDRMLEGATMTTVTVR